MKTEQHKRLPFSLSTSIKPAAYFILLLLSYTLGYLSHPSQFSPSLPPHLTSPAVLHLSTTVNTTDLHPFQVTTQCANPLPPETIRKMLIDRLFNGSSPFLDFPPANITGKLRRTSKVKGWGSNGAVFENLIREVKPRIIVEVGTFLGASALHMAELTQRLGLQTQILCIDDFRGWAGFRNRFNNIVDMVNGDVLLYYQFLQNVVTFNKTESVLPVPFSSGSSLMKLCEWGVWADLVEIDAGHDFFSAWSDINRGYSILRPGGVIFGHDYFTAADNRGVRRAVNLFARIHHLKVKIDGQHWVIRSI